MHATKPVKVIVVPARPPIDKYVAMRRVWLDNSNDFRLTVEFCDVNQPTPEHLAYWRSKCSPDVEPYLIDVGEKKYHQLGSSAAEVELTSSETKNRKTLNYLLGLINDNNRTGNLKNRRHSIAKLVRDAYHVMNGGYRSQGVVFEYGMDVVNAYFFDLDKRAWDTLSAYANLQELWNGFGVTGNEVLDFTLPLYFRQLFMSGRSAGEIVQKISWWLDKAQRVAVRRAAIEAKSYQPQMFLIQGRPAGLLHVEDYFEAEEAPYKLFGDKKLGLSLLIARDELGHVHIKSSFRYPGMDFDKLYEVLNRREPGCWYLEKRFKAGPMLMNGSRQFTGVTPTAISDDKLIQLVSMFVRFKQQ